MLRLYNPLSDKLEAIPSAEAVSVRVLGGDAPRRDVVLPVTGAVFNYLGYEVRPRAAKKLQLALGPTRGAAPVKEQSWFRWLCLTRHYRAPLELSAESLASAREELERLAQRSAHIEAAHGAGAPNPSALAGYKARFREALSEDLDIPQALHCVWDALRPGALSGPTQREVVREVDGLFSLGLR